MIRLLHGTNRLGIEERVRGLRREHDPEGLNSTSIEAASTHLGELRSSALAPGFFGETRLVIAFDTFVGSTATGRKKPAQSKGLEETLSLLQIVPESTVLVVVEQLLTPAQLRPIKTALPKLEVERLDVPRGYDLRDWAISRAASSGAELKPSAALALLEALFPGTWRAAANREDVPPNLYRLDSEIAKLVTAALPAGDISTELVDSLVAGADERNIWGLTNAIAEGNPGAAIREVERALEQGTAPDALIGQLAGQYEAFAALAFEPSSDIASISQASGTTEGRLRQSQRNARAFPRARVVRGLATLRAIEVSAKRGDGDLSDLLPGVVAQMALDRG